MATEKQIPLPELQSVCDERFGFVRHPAHRLAIAMNQGLPLDRAIVATEIRLPNDALVAVRTGCVAGGLGPMLKSVARHASAIDLAIQGVVGRVAYLSIFIIFMSLVMALYPRSRSCLLSERSSRIFTSDCRTVTLSIVQWSYLPFHSPIMVSIFIGLLLALVLVLLYTLARYTGLLRWDPPIVRRLSLPLDESLILRSLAESVDSGKPMERRLEFEAISQGIYPAAAEAAGEQINEGALVRQPAQVSATVGWRCWFTEGRRAGRQFVVGDESNGRPTVATVYNTAAGHDVDWISGDRAGVWSPGFGDCHRRDFPIGTVDLAG